LNHNEASSHIPTRLKKIHLLQPTYNGSKLLFVHEVHCNIDDVYL